MYFKRNRIVSEQNPRNNIKLIYISGFPLKGGNNILLSSSGFPLQATHSPLHAPRFRGGQASRAQASRAQASREKQRG